MSCRPVVTGSLATCLLVALCGSPARAVESAHPTPGEVADLLAPKVDSDGDGLDDALEASLLARWSPIVLLAPDEPSQPASVGWIRARTRFVGERDRNIAARFDRAIRAGSRDRADWTMYGHVYPRVDGGINVQYWFYFPFNEAPLFFDHESDWEHVTVELAADGLPSAVSYAQHHHNAPGVRVHWSAVPHEGTHPFVLTAWGTHASYPSARGAPFWEDVRDCPRSADGTPQLAHCNVRAWRIGEGGSRVVNLGERGAPAEGVEAQFVMSYGGPWGASGDGGGAPEGPPFQRAYCADAATGRCGSPHPAPVRDSAQPVVVRH